MSITLSILLFLNKALISVRVIFSSFLVNSIGVIFLITPVDTVNNHIKGLKIPFIIIIGVAENQAYFSGICKANCFGYNSPNTNVI